MISLTSKRWFWPLLCIGVIAGVYIMTLLPGVGYWGDTPKFAFIGKHLGTSHAPGYPTYTLLNFLFVSVFPFGSLIYKANLLSAVFAIMGLLVMYQVLLLFGVKRFLAGVSILVMAFTPTLWSQSIVAEVYSLHFLFLMLVMFLLLKWSEVQRDMFFYLACFVYAISFGNHLMMIAILPAFAYLVWMTDKSVFLQPKKVLAVMVCILLGMLQYGYLLWRFHAPETSYLELQAGDLSTLLWNVTGGPFKSQMFPFSLSQFLFERIPLFIQFLVRNLSVFFPFAILGVFSLRDQVQRAFLLLIFFGNAFLMMNYDIHDIELYVIPNIAVAVIFLAVFLDAVCTHAERYRGVLCTSLALIPLLLCLWNYSQVDQSSNTADAIWAEATIEAVGRDAIIIPTQGYSTTQYLWYYLIGEQQGKERNVYATDLLRYVGTDTLIQYLEGTHALFLPHQRLTVPYGLSVFVTGESARVLLLEDGLVCVTVLTDLCEIQYELSE